MGDRSEVVFSIMMAAFVVILVLTNVIAGKLFLAFPETFPDGIFGEAVTLTAGLITYPLTFLLTDVVCEVYGQRRANLMVVTGFVMSILMLGIGQYMRDVIDTTPMEGDSFGASASYQINARTGTTARLDPTDSASMAMAVPGLGPLVCPTKLHKP